MSLSKFFIWLIPVLIISVFGLIVGFIVLSISGNMEGREFSPENFSIRKFTYNKIPFFDWVISPKETVDQTGAVQADLVNLGFLPSTTAAKNWHLISELNVSSSLLPPECDARFLTHYLELQDSNGVLAFVDWNEKHPHLAPLFWPHVIEMARQESYLKIPEIMEFALTNCPKNPNEFSDVLNTLVAEAYLELGKIDYEQGRLKRAKVRLQLSLDAETSAEARSLLEAATDQGAKKYVQ